MILVFGRNGQVGTELARHDDVLALDRAGADLTDPEAVARAIRDRRPRAVINAAAHTAVDRAESEPDLAFAINAWAPGAMARACAGLGIPLVHISTDYVFDGTGDRPWQPGDPTGPLGVYGASKLAGEQAVTATGGAHVILRTSWVFSAHGANFVKTMLRLGAERETLNVVSDQIGAPTPAADIALACLTIAGALIRDPARGGIHHFAGSPDTSWAGFARGIMARAGLACRITDIPTSDYPAPARRPENSRLDCAGLEAAFAIPRPDWRVGLDRVLQELKGATP